MQYTIDIAQNYTQQPMKINVKLLYKKHSYDQQNILV